MLRLERSVNILLIGCFSKLSNLFNVSIWYFGEPIITCVFISSSPLNGTKPVNGYFAVGKILRYPI